MGSVPPSRNGDICFSGTGTLYAMANITNGITDFHQHPMAVPLRLPKMGSRERSRREFQQYRQWRCL